MHVIIWPADPDRLAVLRTILDRATVPCTVVSTAQALLGTATAPQGCQLPLLDVCDLADAMERCAFIASQTESLGHIIHQRDKLLTRHLANVARGPVVWLEPESIGFPLIRYFRLLKATWAMSVQHRQPCIAVLSHRERQVLQLHASGQSYKQVATRLGISESTVRTHLANAANQLGVSTCVEAVSLYNRLLAGLPSLDTLDTLPQFGP